MTRDQKIGVAGVGASLLGVLYLKRSRTQVQRVPVSTQGAVQPYTPQTPVTLQPGESLYDPNSEALINTPTAGAQTPGVQQSAAPSQPGYSVNVNYPRPVVQPPRRRKPTKRKQRVTHGRKAAK